MRLIDADALMKAMNTWDKFGFSHSGAFVREPKNNDYVPYVHYDDMVKCVEGMPTADVPDRKVGEWKLNKDGNWACPFCKFDPYHDNMKGMNYCPNCGARMKGEDDE